MRFPLSLTMTIPRQAESGTGGGGHYDPEQPRDWHGRWTSGADQGGRVNLLDMAGTNGSPSSPDLWQVRNMADALSRTSNYSGAVLHYQMQAGSDPEGTSAEAKAVAAEMAKTDPDSADRFLGQMRDAGVVEGSATLPKGVEYAQANTGSMSDARPAGIDTTLPPPTDKLVDPSVLNETLKFDPIGDNHRITAMKHPVDAWTAKQAAEEAMRSAQDHYPSIDELHNSKGDAFRHALWSYKMTESLGADRAKLFSDSWERTRVDPAGERCMDLYNNAVGRQLATDPANHGRSGEEIVADAIRDGKLQLRPFNVPARPSNEMASGPLYK